MNTKNNSISGRMQWIDFARGLAIILVVYRHSIVGLSRSGIVVPQFLFNLQEYVYNFRMPVFFALSGIFLAKSLDYKKPIELIYKKVATLFYPYIFWTLLIVTLQIFFSAYTNTSRTIIDYTYIITQPRNLDHMWYLLALFNASLLYLAVIKWWCPNKRLHLILSVILYLISYFIRDSSFFSDLFYHYVFLVFGALFSKMIISNSKGSKMYFLNGTILMFHIFILGQWSWQQLVPGNIWLQIPFLFIILIACIFFYFLCNLINTAGSFKFLLVIGRNSLPVYILHLIVISSTRIIFVNYFHFKDPYIILLVSMVLGLLFPILIYRYGQPFGIEYLFTWGGKTKIKNG